MPDAIARVVPSVEARPVLSGLEPTFRAVAEAVVPSTAALDPREWHEVESIVDRALRERAPRVRRQLRLFMRALDVLALLLGRRVFRRLDPARRRALLARLQDAPLLLLRRGAWGLRTLVLMGYYGRAGAAGEIGYRASIARGLRP